MEDLAYIYLAYEEAEQHRNANPGLFPSRNSCSTQPANTIIERDRPESAQESDYTVDPSAHFYPSFFYV
ncbi:MAG: hypothetical protein HC866_11595 [Leptolyngbyaceae cyanobacterium RU_5_1]|nr:hypothetical protein [Leptolyngbyaceae cyanobacterium RU_5_1]